MKRIALFTLGQYRRTASPEDLAAFVAAFKNYAMADYQSYFAKYASQTLKVIGSTERTPTDFIVADPADRSRQADQPPAGSGFPRAHRHRQAGGGGFGRVRASGWRWKSATSSPPSWARTTAISEVWSRI